MSNDEVAAVIVKYRIRERVRQGIRSISSKLLQPLAGRNRSRSIGDADQSSTPPISPMPGLAPRRRSVLGFRQDDSTRTFHVNKAATLHLAPPDGTESPHLASSSSLDKMRVNTPDHTISRERSTSNASNSGFGLSGKLIRMISRTSSQRSRFRRQNDPGDVDDINLTDRLSLDDNHSLETGQSPERFGQRESRMKGPEPVRRGSNLSEDLPRRVQEEVDWDEAISDEEEYVGEPIPERAVTAPSTPIIKHRSPSQSSSGLSHSPLRPMHVDRARSPLRTGLEPEEEEDQGLAFSISSKRGRRPSVLEKASLHKT